MSFETPERKKKENQESLEIAGKLGDIFVETDLDILEKAIRSSGTNVRERMKMSMELAERNAKEGKELF